MPDRLCGLEIDNQIEPSWLLDWQIGGFCAAEQLDEVAAGQVPKQLEEGRTPYAMRPPSSAISGH